jgi:hypothetical protein
MKSNMCNTFGDYVLQVASGTHVKVSSPIKVLLMVALATRENIQTLEPQSTNERLDP